MTEAKISPSDSCLYYGRVLHHRMSPHHHRFGYWLQWLYLNLQDIDETLKATSLLSKRTYAPISFCEEDHHENQAESLIASVRRRVAEGGVELEEGPICLLTQPRCFGFYFCPLSMYYCFDPKGEQVVAILAEVTNTPWGERHDYVLDASERVLNASEGVLDAAQDSTPPQQKSALRFKHPKSHHVSPFLPMNLEYRWRLTEPAENMAVSLNCFKEEVCQLATALRLKRKPMTSRALALNAITKPIVSASLLGSIYYQAFWLWLKKTQFFSHPNKVQPNK